MKSSVVMMMAAGMLAGVFASCRRGNAPVENIPAGDGRMPGPVAVHEDVVMPAEIDGEMNKIGMPKAVIYKTDTDVADHVPVTLNPDGTLRSFPAPSDLGPGQTPMPLADGWFLDRRGAIGRGTAFLSYTYAQYESLAAAPSPKQLLEAIMPGVKVTEACRLPLTATEACADTAAVNTMIRAGLKTATQLLP